MVQSRGTNPYFNNYNHAGEQDLLEDLLIEAIKIHGMDTFYVPRVIDHIDPVFNEDSISRYEQAIPIEVYVNNTLNFDGMGPQVKQFGNFIADQITFTIAMKIFRQEITEVTQQVRPNEGDLIYFPFNQRLFQIKYVDQKPFMWQLGKLPTYELVCEVFKYRSQRFSTGIAEIDSLQTIWSNVLEDWAIRDSNGELIYSQDGESFLINQKYQEEGSLGDRNDQGDEFQEEQANNTYNTEEDDVVDWEESDPFSRGGRY
jgi:hypothetical protein